MHPGTIGGIIGGVVGVIGGLVGSYYSIKNAKGPKERAFVTKAVFVFWVGGILFLVLLFCLPEPLDSLLWIPYAMALPFIIQCWNKRQQELRAEEGNG